MNTDKITPSIYYFLIVCAIKTANHGRSLHRGKNATTLSTAAISYLGEQCILLEPVLYTPVELLGQMVLDI